MLNGFLLAVLIFNLLNGRVSESANISTLSTKCDFAKHSGKSNTAVKFHIPHKREAWIRSLGNQVPRQCEDVM